MLWGGRGVFTVKDQLLVISVSLGRGYCWLGSSLEHGFTMKLEEKEFIESTVFLVIAGNNYLAVP